VSIWTYRGPMRENELSLFSKSAIGLLVLWMALDAAVNIVNGEVRHPGAFVVVLVGVALFSVAKVSVIRRGTRISFGTSRMTENMANTYRIGYWLMIVGILVTFP
jgi:glucan phosphoethanolaminetransferase (alkaline phosphatase superfamily)